VDSEADIQMAVDIVNDSKTQYVAVCNATETLLVHSEIAGQFLPLLKKKLDESNVELRGCERTRKIIDVVPASEDDWKTEYLDYILSVKIVDSVDEAIEHINTYGSGHTDAIITKNRQNAEKFMDLVDSGNVSGTAQPVSAMVSDTVSGQRLVSAQINTCQRTCRS